MIELSTIPAYWNERALLRFQRRTTDAERKEKQVYYITYWCVGYLRKKDNGINQAKTHFILYDDDILYIGLRDKGRRPKNLVTTVDNFLNYNDYGVFSDIQPSIDGYVDIAILEKHYEKTDINTLESNQDKMKKVLERIKYSEMNRWLMEALHDQTTGKVS